ncbi:MAG: XdhC family protein [Anaerolineales bacterium]
MPDIDKWIERNEPVALATVVQTWGSSPRAAGAKMAVTPGGGMTGSVSGGCVEGATFEEGVAALKTNRAKLVHFGVADETAWEVGLACGGSIDVFVQPLDRVLYATVRELLQAEKAFAVATLVKVAQSAGDEVGRGFVLDDAGAIVARSSKHSDAPVTEAETVAAREALAAGQSTRAALPSGDWFIEVVWPSPTLIVVGGVHTTIALTALAKTMGYRTVVVDPRKAFGSEDRFPHVDTLVQEWPDDALKGVGISRATAIAMLTHDPKLDDPGLEVALRSNAFYIGALGSKNTQEKRRTRLREAGLTDEQLARLRGPIGLDLGGRTPEEVALAIMAEIVAARNGRLKLGDRSGT